ncbi:MAG: SPOR domain-containing protein [Candidatus Omnitrophota bacterium]
MKKDQGRFIFYAILLAFVTGFAIRAYASEPSITRAEKFFLEGRYDRTISELDMLIDSRSSSRSEAYYLKGLALLKLKRFGEARENFFKVTSRFMSSRNVFDAYLGIGDSYFLEGNTEAAVQAYKDILKKYPGDKNISIVKGRLEDCYRAAPQIAGNTPPAVKAVSSSGVENRFSVQVGSFKKRTNAVRLADKLKAKGYDSYVETSADPSSTFYRVKVGRYVSGGEAKSAASRLKGLGYPTKICTDELCR